MTVPSRAQGGRLHASCPCVLDRHAPSYIQLRITAMAHDRHADRPERRRALPRRRQAALDAAAGEAAAALEAQRAEAAATAGRLREVQTEAGNLRSAVLPAPHPSASATHRGAHAHHMIQADACGVWNSS
jgi:hypothetical protein